jgi:glycosyltransferase involved in cell wall biosynthesis
VSRKILFIDQSGQLGGAELCLADLAEHHRPDGSVLLFSQGPFADLLQERGITVKVLPLPTALERATKKASPMKLISGLPSLARHVRAVNGLIKQADAIYLNTAKALLEGTAANLLPGKPCVFHLHDLWNRQHFSAANIRILLAAANRADAVIANSQATADTFVAAGGRAPVHVIPNGFDPAIFDAVSEADATAIRRQWNPEDHPVAAVFGRLSRWKGQDVLIRAAERVPGLSVWIVGEALFTADDREYAAELKEMAAAAGGRIRFLGFRDDVFAIMRAADIIVHSSVAPEPFGRVVVEGMFSKKPVIAARDGGPLEIVENEVTGYLVPPSDDETMARRIRQLAESPTLREDMGQRGRKRAEHLYALPAVLEKIDSVISAVLQMA